MSRIEELLRQAYQEAADTVRPDGVRQGVPRPRERRARRRFTALAPLAAAVAVVITIAVAVALPRLLASPAPALPAVTSVPPPFLVQLPYTGAATEKFVVQAAGTRHVTGTVPPPAGLKWVAVAATPSGTAFVAAATDTKTCVTRLYDLSLTASGKLAGLTAFGKTIAGQLPTPFSLAADGDGGEVAYGSTACGTNEGNAVSIGLMTPGGISRQWTLPPGGSLRSLSLTPDGHTLVYQDTTELVFSTIWRLSATAPSGSAHARSHTVLAGNLDQSQGIMVTSAAIGIDGTTVYITTQSGNEAYTETLAAYRMDGTLLRTLHTWRNISGNSYPAVTSGGAELLVGEVTPTSTFEVDPDTGKTTSLWIYLPSGALIASVAW